jgi:ketosteroid isomerase-like protein
MKRIGVITLLALLATLPAYSQAPSATEQEVMKAFHALDDATRKKDRASMERMMADDYLYSHSTGKAYSKAQEIAESMSSTWTGSTFADMKVRVYGDVAIVTGVQTLAGTMKGYASGARRITDLWIKRGGGWQSIGGQSTIVTAK